MTAKIRPLVAGNWKMNGMKASLVEISAKAAGVTPEMREKMCTVICMPATLIVPAVEAAAGSPILIGAQDCHFNKSGAHTGEISPEMLADAGASTVIVGHSERRADNSEDNEIVKAKSLAGLRAGLQTILCIGETEAERKAGRTLEVLGEQLDGSLPHVTGDDDLVIAYEPVWAIGTGLVPTTDDIKEAHAFIRELISSRYGAQGETMRILYGGSVKPSNAAELLSVENVNGALIGGASLKAEDFLGICSAVLEI